MEIRLLNNYPKLIEILEYAKEKLGNQNHVYIADYIVTLWQSELDTNKLMSYFNSDLLALEIPYEKQFYLGRIAIELGQNEVGAELIFQATYNNQDDYNILTQYLTELNKAFPIQNENYRKDQNILIGDYISIKIDSNIETKEVNQKTINSNIFIKHIYEHKILEGDTCEVKYNGGKKQLTLVKIYDKYQGLYAQILEKAWTNNLNGSPINVFTINPQKDLIFQMMKLFGNQGDERKEFIAKNFQEYFNYFCSFSELVYRTNRFPLDIYHILRLDKKDFRVFPRILYQNCIDNGINFDFDFVIDFTTIFPLMTLSEHYEIRPNKKKFLIAPLMIIIIKNEILKTNGIDENGISFNISSNSFLIHPNSKEEKEARLKYLQSILDWIDEFCTIEYAVNNLDILRKIKNDGLPILNDSYFQYMLECSGLYFHETRYFLSEDHNPLMKQIGRIPISLEMYLLELHPKIYDNELLPQLINLNHKGLLINLQSLLSIFKQGLDIDSNNLFWMYIDNLKLLTNGKNIDTTLNFIHYVYTLTLDIKFQSSITRKILRIVLPEYINKHFEAIDKLIKITILSKFRLMGEKKDFVISDFKIVIEEILNHI